MSYAHYQEIIKQVYNHQFEAAATCTFTCQFCKKKNCKPVSPAQKNFFCWFGFVFFVCFFFFFDTFKYNLPWNFCLFCGEWYMHYLANTSNRCSFKPPCLCYLSYRLYLARVTTCTPYNLTIPEAFPSNLLPFERLRPPWENVYLLRGHLAFTHHLTLPKTWKPGTWPLPFLTPKTWVPEPDKTCLIPGYHYLTAPTWSRPAPCLFPIWPTFLLPATCTLPFYLPVPIVHYTFPTYTTCNIPFLDTWYLIPWYTETWYLTFTVLSHT